MLPDVAHHGLSGGWTNRTQLERRQVLLQAEALAHYKEAANLAPGNRVTWNARPFRPVEVEVP